MRTRATNQASAIHLQAATVSGVQIAAAMANSKPNMSCLVSEPTLAISVGNHLLNSIDFFTRFKRSHPSTNGQFRGNQSKIGSLDTKNNTLELNPLGSDKQSESSVRACHRYRIRIHKMDTAAALKETRLQRENVLKLVTEARLQRLEAELKSTKRSQSKEKSITKRTSLQQQQ